MSRTKIDYGIDLGTTNSSISRMENGKPIIKKTDTLKDTMPSCVYINKKKAIRVGDSAYNAMKSEKLKAMSNFDASASNSFIEFKRTMGTDKKYYSSNMDKEFSSEELSAEVLKTLESFVTDEEIKSVVITVPAKFTVNQKDATVKAAKLTDFKQVELLQEPIAASIAYGLDTKNKNGHWLVFDFGGGTFDAALLKVEDGIMKVIDTEGDNFLGGKNLDYAIVYEIIIPYLRENFIMDSILADDEKKKILREAMKFYAEEARIQMSFKDTFNILTDLGEIPRKDDEGKELELDITVTQEMMQNTLSPIFQKAIDISKNLLDRNYIFGKDLDSLILVGGPTYSPILRKMLEEQITKPDTSVDPMTVVSKGAALYASTIDIPEEIIEQERDKTKIQLDLGYESTTVEESELVTIKILKDKTEEEIPEKVFVDIVRRDKAWSSGKTEINEKGDIIEVKLEPNKANAFNIIVYDTQGNLMSSKPSEFTIIQGIRHPSAILNYFFGIEIFDKARNKKIFYPVKGLEKNQPIPCTGIANDFKVLKQIRPGNKDDFIKIPIYQGEYGAEGTKAILNEHVYDVIITGDDIPGLLPKGSSVDITMKVDSSELIKFFAYFPTLDFTYEAEVISDLQHIDTKWLEKEISHAEKTIKLIKEEEYFKNESELTNLENEIYEIRHTFEQDKNDVETKKSTLNYLRNSLKKLDKIEGENEWLKIEHELKEVFYRLEETNKQFGNDKTNGLVEQFKEKIPEVIKNKDRKFAKEFIDNMRQLDFSLADEGLGVQMEIMFLKDFNDNFDTLRWENKDTARITLDRGLELVANNPTKEELRPIVIELFKLLPESEQPDIPEEYRKYLGK